MALGGGTWLTQNKVLPGAYINFSSLSKASATLSDRGIAAVAFPLDWGAEDKVLEITPDILQTDSVKYFGYAYNAPQLMPFRELFATGLIVLYWYRITSANSAKATCIFEETTLATAKYAGSRPNGTQGGGFAVSVTDDPDTENYIVKTWVDGEVTDAQSVATSAELKDNSFVIFNKASDLSDFTFPELNANYPQNRISFTGGDNGTDSPSSLASKHQAALNAFENYAFNTLGCAADDWAVRKLYESYTKRMRDEVGAKFQCVIWRIVNEDNPTTSVPYTPDFEGILSVDNAVTGEENSGCELVYWMTGAAAACAVNRTNTNKLYNGELSIDYTNGQVGTLYTQRELERAIDAGKIVFHMVGADVRVLSDINTLRTVTDTKGDDFKRNQTIRVCDQIANDVAVVFNTRYLGVVQNDEPGRTALWNDIVKLIQELEKLRAVENFDPEIVTTAEGDTKESVLVNIGGLDIVHAMAKLYMSVVIA
jgi:hypothetical protein